MVHRAEDTLKAPASELIRAARRPATTIPRTPVGSTWDTSIGKACWALSRMSSPLESKNVCCSMAFCPLLARAKAIMPGMMKMKTGRSLSIAAAIEPRRASCSFWAERTRWTMYWSVHQYHSPMTGAQNSIPIQG